MRDIRRRLVALAVVTTLCAAAGAAAGAPAPGAPTYETTVKNTGAGEPVIAWNPHRAGQLLEEDSAGISLSNNYGRTWTVIAPGQVDPAVAVDGEGRFFAHADKGGVLPLDGFWIEASTDQGKTWSAPVQTFQFPQPSRGTVIGWDRPWLTVDPRTGAVYASIAVHTEQPGGGLQTPADIAAFAGCHATVFTNALLDCGRRYYSASHDHGRTFGDAHPLDSPEYPDALTGGFSGIPIASGGVLATFYYASRAPGATCPCVIFETSHDDGAHWSRHIIPGAHPFVANGPLTVLADQPGRAPYLSPLITDSPSVELGPYGAADPAHPGRFAVAYADRSHAHLLVYETSDSGRRWTGPVTIGVAKTEVDRPWISFGPTGALGMFWRADTGAEGSAFNALVDVAPAGDLAFTGVVRLNRGPAPGSNNFQDDDSFAAMDGRFFYATWGDTRAGGQIEPWFGRCRYR